MCRHLNIRGKFGELSFPLWVFDAFTGPLMYYCSGSSMMNIHDHGVTVDRKKSRVRCNYCGKQMSGFFRLKRHLGGIRGDVIPCEQVSDTIRDTFRCLLKNNISPSADTIRSGGDSCSKGNPFRGVKRRVQTDEHELMSKKCIARFFYENSIDFSAVESHSFREMLSVGHLESKIPSSKDLNGWILKEEVKEMEEYVKRIKDSWAITGCSLLLDAWIDKNGRDLATFVADCPKGAVYLKSCDVSDIKNDMIALTLLVDEIVNEIGAENVVQIIGCSVSGWIGELGKYFTSNHREIFWSTSVSHCFELMLNKIGKLDFVIDVLEHTKNISTFIHNDPSVLKLFKDHSHGKDLTVISKNDSTTPYLTLERILTANESLTAMFSSSEWNKMKWAFSEEGKRVAKLIKDSSLWNNAEIVSKCTMPLVRGLFSVVTADKPQVGLIYDTMDEIKERIGKDLNRKKFNYKAIWDIIDEIWDTHLHTPLHAAGYFLNPFAFYSTDFHLDPEVTTGLVSSLLHLVKDRRDQLKIVPQLDLYRLGKDSFYEASRVHNISDIDPAEWWGRYANEQPELQSVAIKILSQTCEGASRFKLQRKIAEKSLLEEEQHLKDFEFVHYNLHLKGYKLRQDTKDPMDIDVEADIEDLPFTSPVKLELV